MLVHCPECELQVSDKAFYCPHCGYPMKEEAVQKYKPSSKRKRLPNGFGQISEIKNANLRNRFRAMISVGKKENGRPVVRLLKPNAYFSTYNEAYSALMEYNRNPYDLDNYISVEDLYARWTEQHFKTLKDASVRNINMAWSKCSSVYAMPVKELRARHIKGCVDNGNTPNIKFRIKSMFNMMLDYALEYEIVDKNYARTFNLSDEVTDDIKEAKRSHMAFTDEEIRTLWSNLDYPYVDVILIQCYGGWRPKELGQILLKNVNLDKNIIVGGMKTEAGTDRIVPIHSKIRELIEKRYKQASELGSDYLINCTDGKTHKSSEILTYDKYQKRFIKIRDSLGLNPEHRAHDGRKHFITMAKKYNLDQYAIKYIVGHSISDITERIYTERSAEWLKSEIEKIK